MSQRDPAEQISGQCAKGTHGRCTGWMVIPNYGDLHDDPDISVRCFCPVCQHPPVDPHRHLTHLPQRKPWTPNS